MRLPCPGPSRRDDAATRRRRELVFPLLGVILDVAGLLTGVDPARAQSRVAVLEEPGGTAVGVAVVLDAGRAWEPASESGVSYLGAQAVVEEVRLQLDALGGHATVECDAAAIRFLLLLPRSTWQAATDLFLEALFEREVSDGAVERAKAELVRGAALQEGNFEVELRTALARALFGEGHRWAGPACGSRETLSALRVQDVRRMARVRFVATRATAAVAGPVETAAAGSLLRRALDDAGLPVLVAAPEPGKRGVSTHVEHGTVTTWVALAYPFRPGADVEALRLLAFQLREAAAPSPARPEVFSVSTEIERHGGGGTLVVSLVTAPERAPGWADRLRELVRRAGAEPLDSIAFEDLWRRYRGRRLLELAAPEARAREAALQLFFDHAYLPPRERIRGLSAERLQEAAASLPPPAAALLGPK